AALWPSRTLRYLLLYCCVYGLLMDLWFMVGFACCAPFFLSYEVNGFSQKFRAVEYLFLYRQLTAEPEVKVFQK
ncbi:MAG: hypothetical protein ACI4W2_01600, partial [Eubacterium sp.]